MRNVLILASDARESLEGGRSGDLFDMALVEIVRALDVPGSIASVLVPWSDDLSPLIAAGIVDTAPSFDPESGATETTRSGLIPYIPLGAALSEESTAFFRSSHLTLEVAAPTPFEQAIREHPPTDVVVLSWTKELARLRDVPGYGEARFLVFGSLTSPERIFSDLAIPSSRVEDLERRLPLITEGSDIPEGTEFTDERERDAGLEPFIPFGLLIQDALDEILPDDEPPSSRERR
jgi:hypothetical protein